MPIPAKNQKKTPNGIHKTDKLIWELTVVTKCWSCGSNNWNPGGASWFKKSVPVVPYSGGGPGHHAPGHFLTTRRDPRGQKMKPEGKASLSSLRQWRAARKERVPTISKSDGLFPKLEYCLEGEAADYFQSGRTFFFGPEPGSALLFLTTDNSTPSGTI